MDLCTTNVKRRNEAVQFTRQSRRSLLAIGQRPASPDSWRSPQRRLSPSTRSNRLPPSKCQELRRTRKRADDETAAFQRALDAAHHAGGGLVYAPPGRYIFRGTLHIPDGVTLRGSFGCVPSHTGMRDHEQPKPGDDGTVLLVTAGRGSEDGEAFITLNTNSCLAGLTIYYPEQVTDAAPIAYPWSIAMRVRIQQRSIWNC